MYQHINDGYIFLLFFFILSLLISCYFLSPYLFVNLTHHTGSSRLRLPWSSGTGEGPGQRQHPLDLLLHPLDGLGRPPPADDGLLRARWRCSLRLSSPSASACRRRWSARRLEVRLEVLVLRRLEAARQQQWRRQAEDEGLRTARGTSRTREVRPLVFDGGGGVSGGNPSAYLVSESRGAFARIGPHVVLGLPWESAAGRIEN